MIHEKSYKMSGWCSIIIAAQERERRGFIFGAHYSQPIYMACLKSVRDSIFKKKKAKSHRVKASTHTSTYIHTHLTYTQEHVHIHEMHTHTE